MRAALRLLWALDVRHLVAHRTRLALSALGIAVGVALAVAVGSLATSISGSLESVAQAAAAEANIEIRPNGNVGLDPSVLAKARTAEGVDQAGAAIESYVRLRRGEQELRVLALGVDSGIIAMAPQAIGDVEIVDPFGLLLPRSVAEDLDVKGGDSIEVTTPSGWKSIRVGAVIDVDSADRTRVVVGTVGVLQQLLERGTRFDVVYVKASDPDSTLAAVQRSVGTRGRAGPIAFRDDQIQQLLAGANASFAVGTLVALFVGAFLVYNTMAMAAVERIQEAALLRAVGAKRRQVFLLFLSEGGLLGLAGSGAGIGLGLVLSSQLLGARGGALEEIYPIQITELTVSPTVLTLAGVAGVIASLAAAFLPARRIAHADPAPSLGPTGAFEDPTMRSRRATNIVGIICVGAGPAVAVPALGYGSGPTGPAMAGFAITLAGMALLIPTVVPVLASIFLRAITSVRRSSGVVRLAAGEVLRSPGRTSYTVGAVLLSLALVVGFSIAQTTFTRAFDAEFEDIISADLYVRSATWRPFGSDIPIDERIAKRIEAFDGVEHTWPFRFMTATYDEKAIAVLSYNLDEFARVADLDDEARAEYLRQARAVGNGDAVLASASFLNQFDARIGETIELPTPTGLHRLRIAESFADPSAITPEIIFDHATFKRIWGQGGADTIDVMVEDGREREVEQALQRALGPRYGFEVDTRDEYFSLLSAAVNSITQLIGSVQLVAVIVAALGLANTLLISTFERRRDLGVLRAVGMLRRQLRRMVAAEALLVGALGVILAWGLGTVIGLGMYGFVQAQLGVGLEPAFPLVGYVGAAVLGLVAALAASMYPAHRAARLDVVEALQYE